MRLLPFRPQHVCDITLRTADEKHLEACGYVTSAQRLELGRMNQAAGPAFSLVTDKQTPAACATTLVACGGVVLLTPQTGMAWLMTSTLARHYPLGLHKTACTVLRTVAGDFHLNRMQVIVQENHVLSRRWLEYMGFEQEGLMKKYIGKINYYLYARIH